MKKCTQVYNIVNFRLKSNYIVTQSIFRVKFMFYKMIENKCKQWYLSNDCTVKSLIDYIEKTGQIRDAQIEAIKTYLFLKVKCECKPLEVLFREGFFNSIDLDKAEITSSTRSYLLNNPAATALFEYSLLKNDFKAALTPLLRLTTLKLFVMLLTLMYDIFSPFLTTQKNSYVFICVSSSKFKIVYLWIWVFKWKDELNWKKY